MASFKFRDRQQAGRKLAEALQGYARQRPIVLALPRGGVPVAYEVAQALQAPLDVCVVRKVGVPWQPELGLGAVAEGGELYIDPALVREVGITEAELSQTIEAKRQEVEQRVSKLHGDRPLPNLRGRTVVLVDDGIATGGTARAAIAAIRRREPAEIVLAAPVAAASALDELGPEVDDLVVLLAPAQLQAIGLWYDDFEQVPDAEVLALLERARQQFSGADRAAETER